MGELLSDRLKIKLFVCLCTSECMHIVPQKFLNFIVGLILN